MDPWNDIHLYFQFRNERLREFYTGALKYLLPPSAWDDRFPAIPPFKDQEALAAYRRGFDEQTTLLMKERTSEYAELMRLAAIGRHSPGRKMNRRTRAKKIEALRRRMKQCLQLYPRVRRPLKGFGVTTAILRQHYLAAPQAKPDAA